MEYIVNQQNIQKYAERLTNDLCRQFFINKAFISGPEILQFNSENQLNLLIIKNIFLNWQKESLKLKSPFFDYEDEAVKQALKTFMNKLSNHIKVYRYDFEPIVQKSIAELVLLAAAPQDFFTKEIEGLANPKVQLSLLKEFCKYIKINKFVIEQVISEIEAAGYTEYFGGETIRHMLKAVNENPDKLAVPETALKGLMDQLPADLTDFVSVPKPMVTRPAFLDEKPEVAVTKPEPILEIKAEVEPEPEKPVFEPVLQATEVMVEEQGTIDAEEDQPTEIRPEIENSETVTEEETETIFPEAEKEESEAEIKEQEEEPKEFAFQREEILEKEPVTSINPEAAALAREPINLNDTLKMTEERVTLAQALKTKSAAAPFKTLVPMHYRFTFINSLFAGNQQAWAEAVEKIDQKETYEEAIAMLKSEYADKYNWDKEEDNLAILFNYVERKF
jgi:hypothetical protein